MIIWSNKKPKSTVELSNPIKKWLYIENILHLGSLNDWSLMASITLGSIGTFKNLDLLRIED
jgi:hypothetical protein